MGVYSYGITYMKYLVTYFLIISFLGIGIFGFALFDHSMMTGSNVGCVASIIEGAKCPTSIMAMTIHHFSVLQALTTTLPSTSNLILLLAYLLLISVSILLFNKSLFPLQFEVLPQRIRDLTLHYLHSRQKIASWLSLFELSPAL